VLCYREIPGKKDISQTCILTVEIPDAAIIPGIEFYKFHNFTLIIIAGVLNNCINYKMSAQKAWVGKKILKVNLVHVLLI
jgi:hypothetical protein